MLAQLIPLQGGEPITITRDVTVVGRQAEHCDLVIERKSVSKMHCVIVKTDGLLFVRDLSSTNGTKVNGQRIIRGALLPGDQLSFAGEKFRVHMGPSPVEPSPVTPHDRTQALPASGPLIDQTSDSLDHEISIEPLDPIDDPESSMQADDLVEDE